MNPLLLGSVGASLLGGIFGAAGQRQPINPALLARLFGPQAISQETQALYRNLLNSPAYSGLMNQAAMQGQRVSSMSAANLARSGFSTSPLGGFLRAAGRGYGATLQRQGQQELYLQALQAALQNVGARQGIYAQSLLQQQQTPSFLSNLGGSLLGAGSQGFLSLLGGGR